MDRRQDIGVVRFSAVTLLEDADVLRQLALETRLSADDLEDQADKLEALSIGLESVVQDAA